MRAAVGAVTGGDEDGPMNGPVEAHETQWYRDEYYGGGPMRDGHCEACRCERPAIDVSVVTISVTPSQVGMETSPPLQVCRSCLADLMTCILVWKSASRCNFD